MRVIHFIVIVDFNNLKDKKPENINDDFILQNIFNELKNELKDELI